MCPDRRAFSRAALCRNGYRSVSMNFRIRIGPETTLLLWISTVLDWKNRIAHGDRRRPAEAVGPGGCSWPGAAIFRRNGASCRFGPEIPTVARDNPSVAPSLATAFYRLIEYPQTVVWRGGRRPLVAEGEPSA
jgi:hypothetical protein